MDLLHLENIPVFLCDFFLSASFVFAINSRPLYPTIFLSFSPDDEGGCVKPLSSKTRKSSQSDLHMRLGLLLGTNHARASSSVDTTDLPGGSSRSSAGACQSRVPIQGHDSSAASFSSLTSFETQTLASTNTSPVSTLTGTSSEAEAAAALRCPIKPKAKVKGKSKSSRDCDSAGSLASISTSVSASTSMSMSMSVSVSGLSNGSSSPLTPRRHSVNASQPGQSDELGQFKNRRSCARRSARTGNVKGVVDTKCKLFQQPYSIYISFLNHSSFSAFHTASRHAADPETSVLRSTFIGSRSVVHRSPMASPRAGIGRKRVQPWGFDLWLSWNREDSAGSTAG